MFNYYSGCGETNTGIYLSFSERIGWIKNYRGRKNSLIEHIVLLKGCKCKGIKSIEIKYVFSNLFTSTDQVRAMFYCGKINLIIYYSSMFYKKHPVVRLKMAAFSTVQQLSNCYTSVQAKPGII
jgi:hypothetical protein